jgi:hypothetical protein
MTEDPNKRHRAAEIQIEGVQKQFGVGNMVKVKGSGKQFYVARIKEIRMDGDNVWVTLQWMYRPADVPRGYEVPEDLQPKDYIYSTHVDVNNLDTVLADCKMTFHCEGEEFTSLTYPEGTKKATGVPVSTEVEFQCRYEMDFTTKTISPLSKEVFDVLKSGVDVDPHRPASPGSPPLPRTRKKRGSSASSKKKKTSKDDGQEDKQEDGASVEATTPPSPILKEEEAASSPLPMMSMDMDDKMGSVSASLPTTPSPEVVELGLS